MNRSLLGAAILLLAQSPAALSHDGPPFPIIVDKASGPYVVSVWADPDVGVAKFFVILAPVPGMVLPEEIDVLVHVRPTSGRLPETAYPCDRQDLRNRVQYYGEVKFDRQEMWQVRVQINSVIGKGEVSAEVEATPPGFGAWDLLIYGVPFLLFGGLWLFAALARRREASPIPAKEGDAIRKPHGESSGLN